MRGRRNNKDRRGTRYSTPQKTEQSRVPGGQGQGREGRVGCYWEEGDRKRFCKDGDY